MKHWQYTLVVFVCLSASLRALTAFSDDELRAPPTPARLAGIE
jgi:hypothetical protein